MAGNMTIKEMIKLIVKDQSELYSTTAVVNSVDESARTCEVTPTNGDAQIFDVRLQSVLKSEVGLVQIPAVDSKVIVTFLNKDQCFVSLCEQVDKILVDCDEITFNGGDNNGLVIVGKLVERLNTIESALNGHITLFNSHTHPVSGTATTPPVTTDAVNSISPTTQQSDLENTKIKH